MHNIFKYLELHDMIQGTILITPYARGYYKLQIFLIFRTCTEASSCKHTTSMQIECTLNWNNNNNNNHFLKSLYISNVVARNVNKQGMTHFFYTFHYLNAYCNSTKHNLNNLMSRYGHYSPVGKSNKIVYSFIYCYALPVFQVQVAFLSQPVKERHENMLAATLVTGCWQVIVHMPYPISLGQK